MICKTLKNTIAAKLKSKGAIARLKELLRYLFHFSEADNTSFRERRVISPIVTVAPY
jgi:hypothetical protein